MNEIFFPRRVSRSDTVKAAIRDTESNFRVYLIINIFFGFAFSPFSQGFGLYLFFYLLWELKYAYNIRCEYNTQLTGERLVLVLSGLAAFMFGRVLLKGDTHPYQPRYRNCTSYESIWSTFTGMGDFES